MYDYNRVSDSITVIHTCLLLENDSIIVIHTCLLLKNVLNPYSYLHVLK